MPQIPMQGVFGVLGVDTVGGINCVPISRAAYIATSHY